MFIRCIRLYVVLTILWLAYASSYAADDSNSTSNNLLLDELIKSCPSDGIPVCGIRHNKQYVIFPNECMLEEVNKDILLGITNFKKIPLKQCIYGCQLNCPKLYKPVCALNLNTYEKKRFINLCEVTKYACKTNTDYRKLNLGECETPEVLNNTNKFTEKRSKNLKSRPIPCTNIFKPVCGSYLGVKSTFKNECQLNAENIKFDRDWRIVKTGICAEDYVNARKTEENPAKPHTIQKRSYAQNNFEDFMNENEYKTNNFVDYKAKSHVANNALYVYIPTPFQTQFLNHNNQYQYQQPIPIYKEYDNIFKKMISLPTSREQDASNHEDQSYGETENKAMPFAGNEINYNYMPNQNSMKESIRLPERSAFNTFMDNDNKEYYYTLEKLDPNHETKQTAFEKTKLKGETEQMAFENIQSNTKTEQIIDTVETTSEMPNVFTPTTTLMEITELSQEKNDSQQIKECKFGSIPICGVLPDGKVQSFDTVCEMMSANIYLTNIWTKLHEGDCESCKYNCARDYQPICVTRNGVNYTMVNDCYFNMGICMDKKSKWNKIANGECERYTRIPDKYEHSKPGFPYTSSYFVSEKTTEIPNSDASTTKFVSSTKSATKPLRSTYRKSKSRKSSSKRIVNRRSSSSKSSFNTNILSKEDDTVTTEIPTTRLSLYAPQTESYIMRLVNDKSKNSIISIN